MTTLSEFALDARARRAARRRGWSAKKSRRSFSVDNYGGFMLVDERNCILDGERFDLSAKDVIDWCSSAE
jgi:hypothetical protein